MSQFKYALSEQDYDNLKDACDGLYAYIFALDHTTDGDRFKEASVNLLYLLHKQLEENIAKAEEVHSKNQ